MLCGLTTLKTRTQRKPIVEQNSMCHAVSVIGYGKPENARSHLLKRMTEMEMDIHDTTYEYDLRTCADNTSAGWCGGRGREGGVNDGLEAPLRHCADTVCTDADFTTEDKARQDSVGAASDAHLRLQDRDEQEDEPRGRLGD